MTLGESPLLYLLCQLGHPGWHNFIIMERIQDNCNLHTTRKILKNKFFVIIIGHLSDNHLAVLKNNPNFTPVINLK